MAFRTSFPFKQRDYSFLCHKSDFRYLFSLKKFLTILWMEPNQKKDIRDNVTRVLETKTILLCFFFVDLKRKKYKCK